MERIDARTRRGVANWTTDQLVERARRIVASGQAAGFAPATGIQE
jgi:hypothetical protein